MVRLEECHQRELYQPAVPPHTGGMYHQDTESTTPWYFQTLDIKEKQCHCLSLLTRAPVTYKALWTSLSHTTANSTDSHLLT